MENKIDELNMVVAKEVAKQVPINDIYDGLAKPSVDTTGQLVAIIPRAINAALTPLHQWILHKEYNIAETKLLLENKLKDIDPENIVQPEPYIAVPTIHAISYCQDNDTLRNLYANLLASSMNKDVKSEVHPSYVEIIKQISPDEAKVLSYIYEYRYEAYIALVKELKDGGGRIELTEYFMRKELKSVCEIERYIPRYLENLERLKLIDIVRDGFLTSPGRYDSLTEDEQVTKYTSITDDEKCNYVVDRRYFRITNYGESFCKICI